MKIQKSKNKIHKKLGLKKATLLSLVTGIFILVINYMFFASNAQTYTIINMSAAVIILGMPLAYRYTDYKSRKDAEAIFPIYLRDVASNISSGMTLPQAMKATHTNNYGPLDSYVREASAKISWGVTFEKAMHDFAAKIKSNSISRTVQTVIETHRSGGQIDTILISIAQSLHDLEKIKKERSSSVYGQMINGYLIYIVFLGVMIGLSAVLIPAFKLDETSPAMKTTFVDMFRSLTVIQGFFAGLAIGKMAEGTLTAGIKHSMVLVIVGYSAFLVFV
jgi:archaeal flagellar protein FlaJ